MTEHTYNIVGMVVKVAEDKSLSIEVFPIGSDHHFLELPSIQVVPINTVGIDTCECLLFRPVTLLLMEKPEHPEDQVRSLVFAIKSPFDWFNQYPSASNPLIAKEVTSQLIKSLTGKDAELGKTYSMELEVGILVQDEHERITSEVMIGINDFGCFICLKDSQLLPRLNLSSWFHSSMHRFQSFTENALRIISTTNTPQTLVLWINTQTLVQRDSGYKTIKQ